MAGRPRVAGTTPGLDRRLRALTFDQCLDLAADLLDERVTRPSHVAALARRPGWDLDAAAAAYALGLRAPYDFIDWDDWLTDLGRLGLSTGSTVHPRLRGLAARSQDLVRSIACFRGFRDHYRPGRDVFLAAQWDRAGNGRFLPCHPFDADVTITIDEAANHLYCGPSMCGFPDLRRGREVVESEVGRVDATPAAI